MILICHNSLDFLSEVFFYFPRPFSFHLIACWNIDIYGLQDFLFTVHNSEIRSFGFKKDHLCESQTTRLSFTQFKITFLLNKIRLLLFRVKVGFYLLSIVSRISTKKFSLFFFIFRWVLLVFLTTVLFYYS